MAKARKGGLGKGLDSLIPQIIPETTSNEGIKEKIVEKPVMHISSIIRTLMLWKKKLL